MLRRSEVPFVSWRQVVYILDQVRALEREMLARIRQQGLTGVEPQILVVTRLIPEAQAGFLLDLATSESIWTLYKLHCMRTEKDSAV